MMKGNWANRVLTRIIHSPIPIRIRNIGASRAVFESEEIQRIDLIIELPYGERVKLEMNPRLAHKLIRELTNAYLAINPPLRNFNGNIFGGDGTGI